MARLSVAPKAKDDGRIVATLDKYVRRVGAMPPGTCPVVVQQALLQAGAAQTCGKCVPCRDGLPRLAALVGRVADCEADAGTLADTLTKRLVGITHRSRLHHHTGAAAIWGIIHVAMLFFRVIPDIDRLNGKQAFSGCPSDDAGIQAV